LVFFFCCHWYMPRTPTTPFELTLNEELSTVSTPSVATFSSLWSAVQAEPNVTALEIWRPITTQAARAGTAVAFAVLLFFDFCLKAKEGEDLRKEVRRLAEAELLGTVCSVYRRLAKETRVADCATLRRAVASWRDGQLFSPRLLKNIEAEFDALDKAQKIVVAKPATAKGAAAPAQPAVPRGTVTPDLANFLATIPAPLPPPPKIAPPKPGTTIPQMAPTADQLRMDIPQLQHCVESLTEQANQQMIRNGRVDPTLVGTIQQWRDALNVVQGRAAAAARAAAPPVPAGAPAAMVAAVPPPRATIAPVVSYRRSARQQGGGGASAMASGRGMVGHAAGGGAARRGPSAAASAAAARQARAAVASASASAVVAGASAPTVDPPSKRQRTNHPSLPAAWQEVASVVDSLYESIPHQCSECGLRFRDFGFLETHQDAHYAEKQREKRLAAQSTVASVDWAPPLARWLETDGTPESLREAEEGAATSPAGGAGTADAAGAADAALIAELAAEPDAEAGDDDDDDAARCAVCGEPFATTYSDARDTWIYKDSTVSRVSPPSLVHKHCAVVQLQEARALDERREQAAAGKDDPDEALPVVKEEEPVVKEEDAPVVKEEDPAIKEEDE